MSVIERQQGLPVRSRLSEITVRYAPLVRRKNNAIPYGRQKISLSDRISVFRALRSRNLTQGPRVQAFEESFAAATGARFAVAFSSGTAALHAAHVVTTERPGKLNFTSPLTFVATVNSIVHSGNVPVLADISQDTWNLDLAKVPAAAERITSVDFAGLPNDLRRLNHPPNSLQPIVVQDCAHSLGGSTPDGPVGSSSLSQISCFSLHPVKAITTGEGGVATTNSEELAMSLQEFRSHGIVRNISERAWEYDARSSGFNYRLTDFQAELGMSQLRKLSRFVEDRNEVADRYRSMLSGTSLELPPAAGDGFVHAYHLFPVLFRSETQREQAFNFLRSNGVTAQVHYRPIYEHTRYKSIERIPGGLAVSENVVNRILSLPIFPGLKKSDQARIVRLAKVASAL